jgi:hypothetical protein
LKIKDLKLKIKGVLIFLTLFLGFFALSSTTYAKTPSMYGSDYGLLVHQINQDQPLSKIKALSVLLKFFPDAIDEIIDFKSNKEICDLPFLNCGNRFYAYQLISQKEFLIWVYQLSLLDDHKSVSNESEDTLYRRLWLNARGNNWLRNGEFTYKIMQEFLYRYKIAQKLNYNTYYEGLILDVSEINIRNFSDIYDVLDYQSNLFGHILELKAVRNRSNSQNKLLNYLNEYYLSFKELEDELRIQRHPLNKIKNLPGYVKENIRKHGLNEVLSQISYDYSKNISNRKYNLTHGLTKISGKIWMPGDMIDLLELLSDQNWRDYKWGWVILGGREEWLLGGGLCGTATIIFTPSWHAGLQIIKRYPHSAYYKNLYPKESFGLDATIYRGSHKNLKIRNNFNSPIMYWAENDTENQVVTLYVIGNSPYRRIGIEGPIQEARTTYKWIRHMEKPDGTVNTEELITRYGAVY